MTNKRTIAICLLAAAMAAGAGAAYHQQRDFAKLDVAPDGSISVAAHFYDEFEARLPEHFRLVSGDFDAARADTETLISGALDRAFAPAFASIGDARRAHYTVIGQYTELVALTGATEGTLQRKLFAESGFNAALEDQMARLSEDQAARLGLLAQTLSERLESNFAFDSEEAGLVSETITIAKADLEDRYSPAALAGRATAAIAGSLVVREVAERIARATLVKAGARTVGRGAAAGAGATSGGTVGLACGPFAVVCSPVLAVGGAVVGWVATDKVIVEVDEAFNGEQFEADLNAMLAKQRREIEADLVAGANTLFDTLEARHRQDMCGLASMGEFVLCRDGAAS